MFVEILSLALTGLVCMANIALIRQVLWYPGNYIHAGSQDYGMENIIALLLYFHKVTYLSRILAYFVNMNGGPVNR